MSRRNLRLHLCSRSQGARSLLPDPPRYESVRSEEHTSELQSQSNLVCRLLLEKKKCSVPSGRSPVTVTATVRPCPMVVGDTETVTAGPAWTDAARTMNVSELTQVVRIESSPVIVVNSLAQLRAARLRGATGS